MRRRILFVINSLTGGGAERVFTTLLGSSADQREAYDLSVALLDEEVAYYPLPAWVIVHRLNCNYGLRRSVTGMWRLVGEVAPDIALSFLTRANVATCAAMAPRGLPFILSERVNTAAHLANGRHIWASRALVRLSYPRADRIIAVSDGVADTLAGEFGVARERIAVVFNPVDTDRIAAHAAERPAIPVQSGDVAAMGRLVPNKNFALAVEAFARSGHPGRLLILGEGPERTPLRALGDKLGLGERLVMPGFLENPYAVIARCAFFVLSSNAEGFSNALVEAMAAGVPVVATDCRSSPAQILDVAAPPGPGRVAEGLGGLLVPVGDPAALAQAMRRLADAEVRARLAALGAERLRAFSVARAVEGYWTNIEAVLSRRG